MPAKYFRLKLLFDGKLVISANEIVKTEMRSKLTKILQWRTELISIWVK